MNRVNNIIDLPGSEGWRGAYTAGEQLAERFPGQDVDELLYACQYNDFGPFRDLETLVTALSGPNARVEMLVQGERDGGDWVWKVEAHASDPSTLGWIRAIVVGGCDYTGWDCQSDLTWVER